MNLTPLTKTVKITIPSTVNVTGVAEAGVVADALATVLTKFATLFGGATATQGKGAWLSPTAGLVIEDVTVVTSFATDEAYVAAQPQVIALAKQLAADMGQEAVALELNGGMYFIEADKAAAAAA